jgi:hypothetical protein
MVARGLLLLYLEQLQLTLVAVAGRPIQVELLESVELVVEALAVQAVEDRAEQAQLTAQTVQRIRVGAAEHTEFQVQGELAALVLLSFHTQTLLRLQQPQQVHQL